MNNTTLEQYIERNANGFCMDNKKERKKLVKIIEDFYSFGGIRTMTLVEVYEEKEGGWRFYEATTLHPKKALIRHLKDTGLKEDINNISRNNIDGEYLVEKTARARLVQVYN